MVISIFLRKADEICALLGCYAAYSGNSLPTYRDSLTLPFGFSTLEDGTFMCRCYPQHRESQCFILRTYTRVNKNSSA